jgi:hypothetical protein
VSDIDAAAVDSLKAPDLERPIREADVDEATFDSSMSCRMIGTDEKAL